MRSPLHEPHIDNFDSFLLKCYIERRVENVTPSRNDPRDVTLVRISLKPHDLRRHAATYASRSRMPIEIGRQIVLRHSNLAATKRSGEGVCS